MEARVVIIMDLSYSMDGLFEGRPKIEHAQAAMDQIQQRRPGEIAIIRFSSTARLCLDGELGEPDGYTMLDTALTLAKELDSPDVHHIIITDGHVDNPSRCIELAKELRGKVSAIFIGEDDEMGNLNSAAAFLHRLTNHVHDSVQPNMLGQVLLLEEGSSRTAN